MRFIHDGKIIVGIQYTGNNMNQIKRFIGNSTDFTTYSLYLNSDRWEGLTHIIKYEIHMDDPNKRGLYADRIANDQSKAKIFDNASQRYLLPGDYILFNVKTNRFFAKPKKIIEEKYTPIYQIYDRSTVLEYDSKYEDTDTNPFIINNRDHFYLIFRFTGNNCNKFDELKEVFLNNSNCLYEYGSSLKFIKKDKYEPIIIMNEISKENNHEFKDYISIEILDKVYNDYILYPGDAIIFERVMIYGDKFIFKTSTVKANRYYKTIDFISNNIKKEGSTTENVGEST